MWSIDYYIILRTTPFHDRYYDSSAMVLNTWYYSKTRRFLRFWSISCSSSDFWGLSFPLLWLSLRFYNHADKSEKPGNSLGKIFPFNLLSGKVHERRWDSNAISLHKHSQNDYTMKSWMLLHFRRGSSEPTCHLHKQKTPELIFPFCEWEHHLLLLCYSQPCLACIPSSARPLSRETRKWGKRVMWYFTFHFYFVYRARDRSGGGSRSLHRSWQHNQPHLYSKILTRATHLYHLES